MPEDPKQPITAEEFEREYAANSGWTLEQLRKHRTVRPCDCGDASCRGWQSISYERAAIYDAASALDMSELEYEHRFFNQHGRLPEARDFALSSIEGQE